MGKTFRLPADEVFAERQALVDTKLLRSIFQERLVGFADGRLELQRLKLTSFSHQPDELCALSYVLEVEDTASGETGEQSLFAIVALDGRAEARFAVASQVPLVRPAYGPAIQLLPELDMLVWGFPNDPDMPHLGRLLEAAHLEPLLAGRRAELGLPGGASLQRVETRVMKAVPTRRCTLRHELSLDDGSRVVLYSKSFGEPGSARQLYDTMAAIWAAPVCRSGLLAIPQPLVCFDELNAVFISDLGGGPIRDDIDALDAVHLGGAIGRGLAGLHGCSIDGLPSLPDDALLQRGAVALAALERVDAGAAARLAAVVDELTRRLPGLPAMAPGPIHGAFRIAQLLLVDEQLALIDFDGFSLSNPIVDVGGFVANLLYLPLRGRCTRDAGRTLIGTFCRAYASAAPWGLPPDQLLWQTVAHLVGKHVKRSLTTGKRDGLRLVDGLLQDAEALLAGELLLAGG